jgi:hypothetical protein
VILGVAAASPVRPPEAAMSVPRWASESRPTKREKMPRKHLVRTKKLFAFLREYRLEPFDTVFQDELAAMYGDTGGGVWISV